MRIKLLKYMLLEDIRLHSELRGSRSFFLFPFVLGIITAAIAYFMIKYSSIAQSTNQIPAYLIIFFTFGIMSGTFGLHATDYLERRFGDYGKLFSNALVLPIKLSNIFLMAAISDSIFYFGWFILPIVAGVTVALILIGAAISHIPLLLLSISLAFILGISLSFFLTVLITRSRILFYVTFSSIVVVSTLGFMSLGMSFFLPYDLYVNFGMINLFCCILQISLLLLLTAKMIGDEYNIIKIKSMHKSFRFRSTDPFLFKDYIDLYRTHGLIAKPLFNVVIPSVLMILLLSSVKLFQGELSFMTNNLVFVAIILGTLSINFFNVLLSGDSFEYYKFLPASLKNFILPKIILSQIICSLQGIVLLTTYAVLNSTYDNLAAAVFILVAFIFYTMCISLFINGLKPNENSLNIVSLGWMIILFLPIILVGMLLPSLFREFYVFLAFAVALFVLGLWFYRVSIRKWTKRLGY